jgi:hypothetical protein
MNDQILSNPGIATNPDTNGIGRFFGQKVSSVARFAKAVLETHDAAFRVEHLAERYYVMNSSDLAQIGLTRDQIPTELRRALCG